MPRTNKAAPARAAQAELARLMASIALGDELELEIEEAPSRYLPPPLHAPATPIAAVVSAPEPTVTPAQSEVSPATSELSPASTCPTTCPSPLSVSDGVVDLSPVQEATAPVLEAEEPTVLTDLPDDLLGWIFAFVHLEQLCRAARPVCHGWRGLVTIVIDTRRSVLIALVSQLTHLSWGTPGAGPCDTGAESPEAAGQPQGLPRRSVLRG